ncbi:MAG TPA: hypothetical protein VGX21_09970 [Methylomirabilota bacterium]|jgi:hypothetical protein|nr:hypothetical protein [Methylomirabilota bacterium]
MSCGWLLRHVGAVLGVSLLVLDAAPAGADEWTFQTGAHVDAWNGSGQNGRQILAPFTLAFDTPDWGFSVRGAYGNYERSPGDVPRGSITGFTDTTVSGYYRLTGAGFEVQLGLGLDTPTGVSRLRNDQLAALTDEDLVTLDRFGEGLDINPTIVIYRNFGAVGLGVGFGYLRAGEYDPTRDVPNDDFDPGDELTGALLGDVYIADAVRVVARASYTYITADQRGGARVFREGDEVDLRLSAEWRPEPWFVVLNVRDIVRFKAERPDATGRLLTEPRNSNGNDLRGGVTVGYILSDTWTIAASAAVRYVDANDYAVGDPLRDGGRTKVAFGPSVTWSPTRTFSIAAGVAYFILDAEPSPIFPTGGTFRGVHADLRLTFRF